MAATRDLLAGRVAIVTGASRGIGAAAARALAGAGASVVVAARSEGALSALADEIVAVCWTAAASRPPTSSAPRATGWPSPTAPAFCMADPT